MLCRHPATRQRLCKNCGGYADTHGGELPDLAARQQQAAVRVCHHCGASRTSGNWTRVGEDEFRCTACHLYQKGRGQLPPADILLKRLDREQQRGARQQQQQQQQEQQGQQPAEEGEEPRCCHCGSAQSGGQWRRHPADRQQRLCSGCRSYLDSHDGALPPAATLERRERQRERQQQRRQELLQQAQQAQQAEQAPADRSRKRKQAAPRRVAAPAPASGPLAKRQRQ